MRCAILLVCLASIAWLGCASQLVAEKARSADQRADAVVLAVKELVEFDEDAKRDAEDLNQQLRTSLDALSAAMQAGKWALIADAHGKLCDVERRSVASVEKAKVRAKALKETAARAEKLKAATAETAAAAEANAAQVAAVTGLGTAIIGGLTGQPPPRITPAPPGADYTGEAITGGSAVVIALLSVLGGKRLLARRPTPPAPTQRTSKNSNTANATNSGTAVDLTDSMPDDPELAAKWRASHNGA